MADQHGFRRDVEALADLGWGPEKLDELTHLAPGQLADFQNLDPAMRQYVLTALAGKATDDHHRWFASQPNAQPIAQWMLTLPAFQGDDDEEED